MGDKYYVPVNKRPECDELDCFDCPYFDHDGNCSADDKIMGCDYCRTAYSDARLDEENDLSYLRIGKSADGFNAFISAQSFSCSPPVVITVQQWNDQHQRNHDIFRFTPKYCPMCGRLITENEPFLSREDDKTQNNV